jgi:hypothetical protein
VRFVVAADRAVTLFSKSDASVHALKILMDRAFMTGCAAQIMIFWKWEDPSVRFSGM